MDEPLERKENVKKRLSDYYHAALKLLFPQIYCPVCGKELAEGLICGECMDRLYELRRCERCGSFLHPTSHYCDTCAGTDKLWYTRCLSAFPYEGEFRRNIVRLKYHGKKYYRHAFSFLLTELLSHEYTDIAFDLATAVPTPPLRLKERGYNQVELYARPTAEALHIPFESGALFTVKENPSLVGMKRAERLQAVQDAFGAEASVAAGKTVLLFDDVFTSGATVNACARALIKAGAKEVYAVVLAGHYTLS